MLTCLSAGQLQKSFEAWGLVRKQGNPRSRRGEPTTESKVIGLLETVNPSYEAAVPIHVKFKIEESASEPGPSYFNNARGDNVTSNNIKLAPARLSISDEIVPNLANQLQDRLSNMSLDSETIREPDQTSPGAIDCPTDVIDPPVEATELPSNTSDLSPDVTDISPEVAELAWNIRFSLLGNTESLLSQSDIKSWIDTVSSTYSTSHRLTQLDSNTDTFVFVVREQQPDAHDLVPAYPSESNTSGQSRATNNRNAYEHLIGIGGQF